jgi:hypothetical protein
MNSNFNTEECSKIIEIYIRNRENLLATSKDLPQSYNQIKRFLKSMGFIIRKGPKKGHIYGPTQNPDFEKFDYVHSLILGGFYQSEIAIELEVSKQAIDSYLENHPELPRPIDGRGIWRYKK